MLFIFPVTQIVSCPIVLPEEKIGSYNSLLVTSSNGLRFLSKKDISLLQHLSVYCVGKKTHAIAKERGFLFVRSYNSVTHLLESFPFGENFHSLYLAGCVRRKLLEETFSKKQALLDILEVYDTILTEKAQRNQEALLFDIVFLTSVFNAKWLNSQISFLPKTMRIFCISERIKQALSLDLQKFATVSPVEEEKELFSLLWDE